MSDKVKERKKELSRGKIILIIFIVFVLVPILILGVIYATNDNFKLTANSYLSKAPGPIGRYFDSYPTEDELENQLSVISNYLLSIENSRAKDKLILIKNENERTYNALIRIMLRDNQNKTSKILEEIRRSTIKDNIIISTLEDIDNEKTVEILEKVKYYENLSLLSFVNEINHSLENGNSTFKDLASIFENMKEDSAANLLKNLDENTYNAILNNFTSIIQKERIKQIITTSKDQDLYLKNMAEIYSSETADALVNIIGNTSTYDVSSLSKIYSHLNIDKGARVLAQVDDSEFVYEIINKIKENEILLNNEDSVTEDLTNAIKIYKEFNNNIMELSKVYEKMDETQAAQLISGLIRNSNNNTRYTLSNGNTITITDENLALEILKSFNDRKIGAILSNLNNNLASDISKKLAYPDS